MLKTLSLVLLTQLVHATPLLDSWYLEGSRNYARIYGYESDITNKTSYTTWSHPSAGTGQTEPVYAGVHEISYDADYVYVRSSGLGSHVMGPWWQNKETRTFLFNNWPGSWAFTASFPIHADPANPAIPLTRTETSSGAIGMFVDGVSMYDSRDAFSWDSANDTTVVGTGYWEQDAYVNESNTFDSSNAHQATETYHYHANPPALRYQLGDSVTYNEDTDEYTEVIGGNGQHSPILGWVIDGLPIYGPYGYSDPMDATSGVRRMISGYQARPDLETDGSLRDAYPEWALRIKGSFDSATQDGPPVSSTSPRGTYMQDYEYLGDVEKSVGIYNQLGVDFDLDEFNTRYCVTPEFPNGVRAYFVCIEEDGEPRFPYNIARRYYSEPSGDTYNNSDTRNNNDFTMPASAVVYAQGGPESAISDISISTPNGSDEITITWRGVEGGVYEVSSSDNLESFDEMIDTTITATTDGIATATITDSEGVDAQKFYQISKEAVLDFDDTGYDLDSINETTQVNIVTITLDSSGPADLDIMPELVTLNGEAVEVVSRPSADQITIYYDAATISGVAALTVRFPNDSTLLTGSYEQTISGTSNVLFIIIDDWGIDSSPVDNIDGAFGTTGGTDLPSMANLENLATESIRFENAYVEPMCSTTRMAIMSGRHPSSTGVGSPGNSTSTRDADAIMTIAEAVDTAGVAYTTGLFGKWHLGTGTTERGPQADGWDHFFGAINGNITDYQNWVRSDIDENTINRAGNAENETEYATSVNVTDTLEFISDQENAGNNWLAWVAFNAPHSPFHPAPTINGISYTGATGSNRGQYKSMLWALDQELQRLLDGVDLASTTVILIGDNGTPGGVMNDTNLFPTTHGKGSIYEGGIHVPLLIRPAGGTTQQVRSTLVNGVDLFPTMCELMGITPNSLGKDLDGVSLIPIINNTDNTDCLLYTSPSPRDA